MKHFISSFLAAVLCCMTSYAQLSYSGPNYVAVRTYNSVSSVSTDVTYYDGLGYPVQQVQDGAGGSGVSVVTPIVYDSMLRSDARTYLPFPSSSTDYDASAVAHQQSYYSSAFGSDGPYAYTVRTYGTSPVGRVTGGRRPGANYVGHESSVTYRMNTASDAVLDLEWNVGNTVSVGTAGSGEMRCTSFTDEDGRTTVTFSDGFGKVRCSRVACLTGNADTYYVYDYKDSLVCAIQPEGSALLQSGATLDLNSCSSSQILDRYAFLYWYDGEGRVVRSKLPGAEYCEFEYDERGRVTRSRDGRLRADGKWIYNSYDQYNDLIYRYVASNSGSRDYVLGRWYYGRDLMQIPSELAFQAVSGIVSSSDLSTNSNRLVYEKQQVLPFLFSIIPGLELLQEQNPSLSSQNITDGGVITNMFNELGSDGINMDPGYPFFPADPIDFDMGNFVTRAYYYDKLGRVVQTVEKNQLGGISRTSVKYDLAGNVLVSEEFHTNTAGNTAGDRKRVECTYDSRSRLLTEKTYVNGLLLGDLSYAYDDLGRMQTVSCGNGMTQTLSYTLQGTTGSRTASLGGGTVFSETLRYESPVKTGSQASYAGNVSEVAWLRNGQAEEKAYAFVYDAMGRLCSSSYFSGAGASASNSFTERDISYDRNGNILALKRYGSSAISDDLSYSYEGNRLSSVNSATYSYDANGNITSDGRRGLTIEYNLLNLPSEVTGTVNGTTMTAYYKYLPDGTKLSTADNSGSGFAYLGSLVYRKNGSSYTFESTDFSGGRIYRDGIGYDAGYFVRDRLGSTRTIVDGSGNIVEQNDYYPFGGRLDNGLSMSATNRYRFSGKEQQTVADVDLLDFGARFYDDEICRWTTIDPLAKKYFSMTPYNYCGNDPVNFVDPDGKNWYSYSDKDGKTQYRYVEGQMSSKEIKQGGYTDLGYTYSDSSTNKYYSLFGNVVSIKNEDGTNSIEGELYKCIDQAMIEAYTTGEGQGDANFKFGAIPGQVYEFSYNGANFTSESGYRGGTLYFATRPENSKLSIKRTPNPQNVIGFGGTLNSPQWYGCPLIMSNNTRFDGVLVNFNKLNAEKFNTAIINLFLKNQ